MSGLLGQYRLEGKTPVLVEDLTEWATWFDTADRSVAKTEVGELLVSTVFLGCTWNEAVEGHARMVALVEAGVIHPEAAP